MEEETEGAEEEVGRAVGCQQAGQGDWRRRQQGETEGMREVEPPVALDQVARSSERPANLRPAAYRAPLDRGVVGDEIDVPVDGDRVPP